MLKCVETAIRLLPPKQGFDETIVKALDGLIEEITLLWNDVTFSAEIEVSSLEDQLEHDFWDKPKDPVTILHEAQRLSRNLTRYCQQLRSVSKDVTIYSGSEQCPVGIAINLNDIEARLQTLIGRTERAIPALLASIAINEGSKASSLTAVALLFAPLSLSVSLVSIDGNSRLGGKQFWVWACIAFPLILTVILVANSSDRLGDYLSRRKGGRALMSFFKPGTRVR